MNTTILLTGLLLLAPAAYTADIAVDAADCYGTPCDQINEVCGLAGGGQCVGRGAEADCMGPPCDQINYVCERVGGGQCLGRAAAGEAEAVPDASCAGNWVCDTVNRVCGGCIPRAVPT